MSKKREKLNLSKQEARELIWGDGPGGFEIVCDKITGNSRWSTHHEIVIKRIKDGKFFRDRYSVGATENQPEPPYEYTEPNFVEVFPVEKKIIVYE